MSGYFRLPAATVLALLCLALCAGPVHAQTMPEVVGPELGQLIQNPSKWATDLFNAALVGLGRQATEPLLEALHALLGDSDLISQTPARLSYDNDMVKQLWTTLRGVANSGLAVVAVWGGVNLIVNPHVRAPYHGALELVPRLLVGAVLVNSSLNWGRLAIDANNALCVALGGAGAALPRWGQVLGSEPGQILMSLIGILIYAVMSSLLLGQMLMRLALVDALLVVSPIALLCWVVPQTYGWARLWFTTFFGTVFVQFLQVAVLQLGSGLTQSLVTLLPSVANNPMDGTQHWLASLLLALATLQLARKVPRLMPGYPGVGASTAPQLGMLATRQLFSFMTRTRSGSGRP